MVVVAAVAQLLALTAAVETGLAAAAAASGQFEGASDASVLVQRFLRNSQEPELVARSFNTGFEAGDEVEVEVFEGVPGSLVMRGIVTGVGSQPSSYNVTVWDAPPEHRFMVDVAPESMRLWKAHRQPSLLLASRPEEFTGSMPVTFNREAGNELDLFSALDADRDGSISRGEMRKAIAQLTSSGAGLQPATAVAAPTAQRVAAVLPPAAAAPAAAPLQVPAPAPLPSGKDCWVSGYTHDACCDLYYGPTGDDNCWDGVYTFEMCCTPDSKVMEEARRYGDDQTARQAEQQAEEARQRQRLDEERRRKEEQATHVSKEQAEVQQRKAEEDLRRKAEQEAQERFAAEARKHAKEEERRLFREQAKKRAEEEAQRRAEEEIRHNAEEAARLEWEQKACPEGYQYIAGDVPGSDQFGREDKLKRPKLELCAKECNKQPLCMSFEWSPTKFQCNLNKIAEPKAGRYLDFTFCRRKKV
mmetsp:Transcript_53790/g.149263  ORF Transcript_53790/g.149263 Transcript_53790/m.149263 type:complete len:473 (-) Transcript_53790:108-1526(-)|eukprot:CAMPEP_0179168274 /NCGR_PEP_ID=MMETSP0796-20121207/82769_1 /TAXON_ID=73915 /ORGANISM="Pyrodinium bahamense, Strain pbaha01" /LENGTH=472 /DNA_ID=CAMNT_0020871027 /DNA_START=111 /DNA_END=1529 /DNA_ORIENTATION=-